MRSRILIYSSTYHSDIFRLIRRWMTQMIKAGGASSGAATMMSQIAISPRVRRMEPRVFPACWTLCAGCQGGRGVGVGIGDAKESPCTSIVHLMGSFCNNLIIFSY